MCWDDGAGSSLLDSPHGVLQLHDGDGLGPGDCRTRPPAISRGRARRSGALRSDLGGDGGPGLGPFAGRGLCWPRDPSSSCRSTQSREVHPTVADRARRFASSRVLRLDKYWLRRSARNRGGNLDDECGLGALHNTRSGPVSDGRWRCSLGHWYCVLGVDHLAHVVVDSGPEDQKWGGVCSSSVGMAAVAGVSGKSDQCCTLGLLLATPHILFDDRFRDGSRSAERRRGRSAGDLGSPILECRVAFAARSAPAIDRSCRRRPPIERGTSAGPRVE